MGHRSEKNNGKIKQSVRHASRIGSYSVFKEPQEVSSVELLRSSILRSISHKQTKRFDCGENCESKSACRTDFSDLSYSNVELKFLQKSTIFASHLFEGKKNSATEQQQLPIPCHLESEQRNIYNPTIDLINSDLCEENSKFEESFEKSLTIANNAKNDLLQPVISNKNSLKLAVRRSNSSIFEDCSTYDIHYDEVSLPSDSLEVNDFSKDFDNVSLTNLADEQLDVTDSKNSQSDSTIQCDTSDDPATLCDTIFSTAINENYSPSLDNSVPKSNHIKQKSEREESSNSKDNEVPEEQHVDEMNTHERVRRRIRKKNRKCKSKEPHVYECPKCKVSYIISTPMAKNAACCLHCDLWTSVDPVFSKREKQQWNNCCIS